MPNVVTIFLHGTVGNHYNSSVERLIMSSKETLVNLLLSHDEWCNTRLFPLDKLTQFPQLSTLGLSILRLHRPFPDAFCAQPLLYMSPLTLLLLDIEAHCQNPEWEFRQAYVNTCLDIFARPGKWFSGVVIPLEWSELEDLWVQACEMHDAAFAFIDGAIDDPLPCYWTVISQISQAGISIRDRNGVGLWEGEGFKLAQRMEAFAESDRFAGYGFGKKL
ncbi:hypothetical protein FRC18_003578 [Serendipita sp. 400]|nr:hypothetical protein FRC18_003578 [Serendipita sp. 400]